MKVKVLFGISAMLLTTQITMAQIKDVVKNDTTTLNKKSLRNGTKKNMGLCQNRHSPIILLMVWILSLFQIIYQDKMLDLK